MSVMVLNAANEYQLGMSQMEAGLRTMTEDQIGRDLPKHCAEAMAAMNAKADAHDAEDRRCRRLMTAEGHAEHMGLFRNALRQELSGITGPLFAMMSARIADLLWVRDAGVVRLFHWRQCASQIGCWIAFRSSSRYTIPKDPAACLVHAVRGFQRSARFNPAQHGEQLRRGYLVHWFTPDDREGVALQEPQGFFCVVRRPAGRELAEPLTGDSLETAVTR